MPGDTPPKDVTKGVVVGLKQEVSNKKHAEKNKVSWLFFVDSIPKKMGQQKCCS